MKSRFALRSRFVLRKTNFCWGWGGVGRGGWVGGWVGGGGGPNPLNNFKFSAIFIVYVGTHFGKLESWHLRM